MGGLLSGTNSESVQRALQNNSLSVDVETWLDVSPEAKAFLISGLDKEPSTRATTTRLLGHDWIQKPPEESPRRATEPCALPVASQPNDAIWESLIDMSVAGFA